MPEVTPDTPSPADLQALFAKLYNDVGDSNACDMFIQRLADGETIDDILSMSHKPVGIRTFIQDPYFMGGVLNNVWPSTIESVVEVIEGGYAEAIFTGSLGRAKTTRATIIAAYNLYVLSCYLNPQERLGLMPNSSLYIVMMNKTEALAKRVTYAKFRKLIERIPYFQKEFPFDKSLESEMRFANSIYVIPSVPNNDNLLGMDVVSCLIDEINFYDYVQHSKRADDGGAYDQGTDVYHGLVTRIKSRFEGIPVNLRGCLSVVSSFKHSEDFTTRRIKEVEQMQNDGEEVYTYISTGSQWDFIPRHRPDGTPRFSETCFKVAIGNKKLKSEIIVLDDDALGREVIEVPDNFREQFKRNIEKALRDLAGRVSGSTGSYFSDPEIVWAAVEMWNSNRFTHLFNVQDEEEGWDLDNGYDILNKQFILRNPHIPRFLHLDLSLTNDWLGLAIGHSPNDKQRPTHIHQGKHELDSAPNVIYDGLLSIRPPKQGQIKYGELRKLIYYIVEKTRIPLKHVSCDGFQSADNLQILAQRLGVTTNVISTEGETPFKTFKNAYEEGRIQHHNHPVYMGELLHLVQDEKTGRVDHTANRCFIGETLVLLQGGNHIMMRDMDYDTVYPVVSFDTRNDCFKVVDAVHPRITQYANELIEIEMEDGTTWQCTPDHLWLTSSGDWVKAEDLTPDDDILSLPTGLLKHG